MARERISEDYEEFEPEVAIWPFILLAFLLQLLPLTLSILLKGGASLPLVLRASCGVLPLLFTASIMRNGEYPWKLAVSSVVYGVVELVLWAVASSTNTWGYALGIPFALSFSPCLLGLLSYVFFLKRRHGKWMGTFFIVILMLIAIILGILRYADDTSLWLCYPVALALLTLLVLPVTRRSDSTPWFVVIPLVLLVLSSSFFSVEFSSLFLKPHTGRMVAEAILAVLAFDQPFWYTLSFLFVFSGLASKSSYRRFYEDEPEAPSYDSFGYDEGNIPNDERMEEFSIRPGDPSYSVRDDSRYTFPSGQSRFSRTPEKEPVAPSREEPKAMDDRPGRDEDEYQKRRDDYRKSSASNSSSNDKWYEFISGGIKTDSDDHHSQGEAYGRGRSSYDDRRDRRDYDDRRDYHREERYRESERDAYRRNLYDDRDRDRYYEDRRDRRDYDDRRDDRYYDRRDDRRYEDRDREDYPRPSRRYEDDYPRERRERFRDDRD